jgi:hypothetical protein
MKNEALAKLEGLVGSWDLMMTDAWFLESPDIKVKGTATTEWLGEAFLYMHSTWEDDSTISWVIGRSDPHDQLTVLSHDDRGVCRVFRMTLDDGEWLMERADPDFHQRIVGTVSADRIDARTEASEDEGKTWRKDFDLIFERTEQRTP